MRDEDALDEVELEEMLKDMSDDLFPEETPSDLDGDEEEAPETEVEPEPEKIAPDPAPAQPEENAEGVQELGAPRTWTKEGIQEWAQVPDRVKQEIHKREDDFYRGIEGYKQWAERGQEYEQVLAPYAQVLAATGTDPVAMFNNLAANHYMLWRGSPMEKVQLAANLMSSYGIDPREVVAFFQQAQAGANPLDPEIVSLRQTVNQLVGSQQATQQAQYNGLVQQAYGEIDAFAAENPLFNEVAEDMEQLLKNGAAETLSQAYEIAVFRNPDLRAKELARIDPALEPSPAVERKRKALAVNVNAKQQPRNGTVPSGTMDETMEDVYDSIMSEE